MRKLLLIGLILALPSLCLAQNKGIKLVDEVETAAGSVAAAYATKLTTQNWTKVEVVNDTDCDVEIQFTGATNTPSRAIPAGTAWVSDFGKGYLSPGSLVALQYMSGETCSSGSVYIHGEY